MNTRIAINLKQKIHKYEDHFSPFMFYLFMYADLHLEYVSPIVTVTDFF